MIPSEPTAATRPTRRALSLTVAGVFFILLLDGAILNTSLPRLAQDLDVSALDASSAITTFLLAMAAMLPMSPWAVDRFGGRRTFFWSVATFTLASAACGLAQSLPQLVVGRVFQGAAGGLMFAIGRIVALRDAPKSELVTITALLVWPALLAPVVGPPLGGFITTYLSWRWNFHINVPLGLVALTVIPRVMALDAAAISPPPLDWTGAGLTAGGLALLLAGLQTSARALGADAPRWPPVLMTAGGALLLALAYRHLGRSAHPLIDLTPLRVRTLAISTVTGGMLSTLAIQATPYLLPVMFQLAFGLSAVAAGSLLLPYFLGNLVMKTVKTPLLRRFGFRHVLIVDGVLAMVAIVLCALLGPATPYLALAALLFFAGATRSMLFTAINTLAVADVDGAQRGAASTLNAVSFALASALGVALATWLLAVLAARQGHSTPTLQDFRTTFVALGLVGLVSVAGYLRLKPDDGSEVSGHAPKRW